ncbi:MAG: DUF4173 domain-containing protein [Bacteroidales bacterium]|nr:DUF4173 domain-containing protein [Bacteroidales bacterium]
MRLNINLLAALTSAVLIAILFHRQPLGLNLLIIECSALIFLKITGQLNLKGITLIVLFSGLILTLLFSIIIHSAFVYVMHFISLFLFTGALLYPVAKSLVTTLGLAFVNLFLAQYQFFKTLIKVKIGDNKPFELIYRWRIYLIPLLIIFIFFMIYSLSNPVFEKLSKIFGDHISNIFTIIFKNFDWGIIGVFIIGLYVSNIVFMRYHHHKIMEFDQNEDDYLKPSGNTNSSIKLKSEYNSGVFLFLLLNLLILAVNIIDINWVWFNFEWDGLYLKQFVHAGTYLLILSILISIGLVLFYFRGDLNFFEKNSLLRILSIIWLIQNGILAISVAMRNFYYIEYFALAYKRIGVFIFLILTIFGLITVIIKVVNIKSSFYIFRVNLMSIYLVLIFASMINWDVYIAKYNFAHSDKAFLHFDFLVTLSDKALPYLDKSWEELQQIQQVQQNKFSFEVKYLTPEQYYHQIILRKHTFLDHWKSKGIISWNYAEFKAYQKLSTEEKNE